MPVFGINRGIPVNRRSFNIFLNAPRSTISMIVSGLHLSISRKIPSFLFQFGLPKFVCWQLTSECNERCQMCWLWQSNNWKKEKNELTLGEKLKVVDELAKIHVSLIYFTGGEPLLNEENLKVFEYTKKKGIICIIDTNATLITKKVAREFVKMKLDVLTVSLLGPEKIHNKIIVDDRTQFRNNFKKSIKGIKEVLKARKENNLPIVKINCVISSLNYKYLVDVYKIARKLNVDMLDFSHLSFIDKPTSILHAQVLKKRLKLDDNSAFGYLLPSLNKFNWNELYKESLLIRKLSKKDKLIVGFYPTYTEKQLASHYSDLSFSKTKMCIYPWFFTSIRPNGDITACSEYFLRDYVLGNLREKSIVKILNGKKRKYFLKVLKEEKFFPGCRRCILPLNCK